MLRSRNLQKQCYTNINKHVAYLRNNGGTKKIEQWLLTDDKNFNAITAERYIISYLRKQNPKIVDNIQTEGIDAYLTEGNSSIGIEITTLNGFLADWILVERLTQILDEQDFLNDKRLDITYSHKKIWRAFQGGTIYNYVKRAGEAIVSGDSEGLSRLNLSIEIQYDFPGYISFTLYKLDNDDSFPWFQYITDDLKSKLQEKSKVKQLKEFPSNLVFVGVNNLSPGNWAYPRIFEDMVSGEKHYNSEIRGIKDFWQLHMTSLTNVIGICYFFYSLDKEEPFYPLRIFWRSEEDKIEINV